MRRRGRRNLRSDEPAADDHELPARPQLLAQRACVVERPQMVQARATSTRQSTGPRSGREHETVEPPASLPGGRDTVSHPLDPCSENELDPELVPVERRPQGDVVARACQQLLREGRALVRGVALLPDDDDAPVEPLSAEGLGAANSRQARTDHDDVLHAARSSVTVIAAIGQDAAAS